MNFTLAYFALQIVVIIIATGRFCIAKIFYIYQLSI